MTIDFTVTRRTLTLGSQDSTTGWYEKSYSASDIEMVIVQRGSPDAQKLPPGVFVRLDAVGMTQDVVVEGDEIYYPTSGTYYEIVGKPKPHFLGDSFYFYECNLHELPLKTYSAPTVTATVEDARYRTKVYLDTYLSLATVSYIVAYGFPDYPLTRVFDTKGIDIVYSIGEPNSAAMMDVVTKAPYGYEEHVPITVCALDTTVKWKGEEELRRAVEENPTGSLRGMERRGDRDQRTGSTIIYMTEWLLNYRRDTT